MFPYIFIKKLEKPIASFFLFSILFICSCHTGEKNKNSTFDFIDVRIINNERILVNGIIINPSSLKNYLDNKFAPSRTINGRIIVSESVHIGLLNQIHRVLNSSIKEGKIKIKFYTESEIKKLGKELIFIDIISNEKILFEGSEIFVEDLDIALNSLQNSMDSKIQVVVTPQASVNYQTVVHIQMKLQKLNQKES